MYANAYKMKIKSCGVMQLIYFRGQMCPDDVSVELHYTLTKLADICTGWKWRIVPAHWTLDTQSNPRSIEGHQIHPSNEYIWIKDASWSTWKESTCQEHTDFTQKIPCLFSKRLEPGTSCCKATVLNLAPSCDFISTPNKAVAFGLNLSNISCTPGYWVWYEISHFYVNISHHPK